MRLLRTAATLTLFLAASTVAAQNGSDHLHVAVRRVHISAGFSGEEVFIYGRVPAGTERVVSVISSPTTATVRLMEKGRVGPFWLGVHQYAVHRVPRLYLVSLSCPQGNVLYPCPESDALAAVNPALARIGEIVGLRELEERAEVDVLRGKAGRQEVLRLLRGFWKLQASRGLYAVNTNRIRLNDDSMYYYQAVLPAEAPEGRYEISAFFLAGDGVIGTASTELFVGRSGMVAWLSRLAERRALLYGLITIGIALAAGWLAGTVFRKRTNH